MQMEKVCLQHIAIVGALGCSRGASSDFRRELLDFALESSHFLQRPLRKDGKLSGLPREQFPSQGGECFAHSLQLLHRLSQNGLSLNHMRTRSSPFLSSGASRTLLKNSTYVLYSALSRSATITSNPNRRRSNARDTRAYSDIGKSRSKLCPGRRTAIASMSFGCDLAVTKLPSIINSTNNPLARMARASCSRRAKSWGRRSETLKTPNRADTSGNSQSKSPAGRNPSELNPGMDIARIRFLQSHYGQNEVLPQYNLMKFE